MESLYVLIPIAVLLAGGAIAAFLWAVRTRQFDDLEMEGKRLLFDDEILDEPKPEPKPEPEQEPQPTPAPDASGNSDE